MLNLINIQKELIKQLKESYVAVKELMHSIVGRGDGDWLDALEVFERTFPNVDVRGTK